MRWFLLLAALGFQSALADTISGTVVGVIDGDTLVVQDAAKKRHTVRLAEIDAPERQQPFYMEASRSLARLCLHKSAQVQWSERDRRKRYVGYVSCAGKDANAEQLRRGMAWASPQSAKPTSALYELETYARLRHIGLWRDENPVAPWEFAKGKKGRL
jgi:endonuclease YncB( thermonuclease family)